MGFELKRSSLGVMAIFAVTIIVLFGFPNHDAYATSFTAVTSGNWFNATTWGGTIPSTADNVTIPNGITVTIPLGSTVILDPTTGALTINSGGNLNINNGGVFYFNSGTIVNNAGTIVNAGSITNNGGNITNSGTITNNADFNSGGFVINNNIIDNLANGTFTNSGITILNSTGTFNNNGLTTNLNIMTNSGTFTNSATFLNEISATLTNSGVITNNLGSTFTNRHNISNSGSISGTGTINNNNGGQIDNNNLGSISINGQFNNNVGATLNLNSGSALGLIAGDTITFSGTSTYSGSFSNSGTFNMNSGSALVTASGTSLVISSGTLTIPSGVTLQINSGAPLTINPGATITNLGTISNTGGAAINNNGFIDNSGGIISNAGTMTINSGAILQNTGGSIDSSGLINNSGIFFNIASGTLTIESGGNLANNSGGNLTNTAGGILINNLGGTLTNSGAFANGNSGNLNNTGDINNNSGGKFSISGAVTNNLGGSITNSNGDMIIFSTSIFNSGTIRNNSGGNMTLGIFPITGVIQNNAGGITINNPGGIITIKSSGSSIGQVNGTLDNFGNIVINSGGAIANLGNGTLLNENSSLITVNSGGSINVSFPGTMINSGFINNTGTIGNGSFLNNTGTITSNLGGSINSPGNIYNKAGGLITNSGDITSSLGGIIINYLGGTITNNLGGTITLSGGFGSGHINNSGIINNHSTIANPGAATFTNSGTINEFCGAAITGNSVIGNPVNIIPCNTISFDQSSYQITTQGTLSVIDLAANTNAAAIDTIVVPVKSTSDPTGINATLSETGVNTGIFTSTIIFSQGASDTLNKLLQTSVGDTVTATYLTSTVQAHIDPLSAQGASGSTTPVALSSPAVVAGGGTTFTITDPGCGTRTGFSTTAIDTMTATVTPASGTGAGSPITITLTEGGLNSCRFTSNIVYFITTGSSSQSALQVRVANPVTTAAFTCATNCDTGAGLGFSTTPTINVYVEASTVNTIGIPISNTGLTCDLNGGDSDNDGVCDDWENGVTKGFVGLAIPNGATEYDYNNGGACSPAINDTSNSANNYAGPNGIQCPRPDHKDLFMELDYMEGYKPSRAALVKVVDAFANAPVQNPDGTKGINLHIILNDDTRFVDPLLPFSIAKGGSFPHGGYEQIKGDFFGTRQEKADPFSSDLIQAKGQVFHYGLFVDNQASPDNLSSGYGEVGGNDFEVSMGPFTTAAGVPGTDDQVAATLMHELGHNLNLNHGGSNLDSQNCKPNYPSIMNYAFQFPGGAVGGIVPNRPLDFSHSQLETLTESALDERSGISRTLPAGLQTVVGGVSGTNTALAKILPFTNNATMGILFDGTNVVTLDSGNNRIMKVNTGGTFQSTFGTKGSATSGAPQFVNPAGIAYDAANTKLIVADTGNNRVMSITSSSVIDKIFPNPTGTTANYLNNPSGVAINGSGFVFVADTGNNRIVVYSPSPTYNYVKTIGGFSGIIQFNQPMSIAFDNASPHNNMFVVDSGNNKIQEFSQANNIFTFVTSVGSFGSGTSPVQFNFPWGITKDSTGNFWVADTGNNRVVKLSSSLGYLGTVGTFGTGVGSGTTIPLNSPTAIAFDTSGNGYIGDAGNNRISKFTVGTLSFVAAYGSYGTGTAPNFITGSSSNTISVNYDRVSGFTSPVSQAIHVLGIADCMPDGTSPGTSDTTVRKTLAGYDDWDNIQLYFRTSGLYANNVFAPITELSQSDAVKITSQQTGNAPPVANAGGPYTANVGVPVTLSAAGSTDPENDITTYQWDLDNDGIPDVTTAANTVLATFSTPGDHTVNLIVRDAGDLTSLASATVHVNPAQQHLTVIKKIVNDNGGVLTISGVTLKINSTTITNGTSYTENIGPYQVSENVITGYKGTFSGACDTTGKVTLASGDNKVCTITNDDQYNYGGILQPINSDGSSIFKLKSTIPVKFQLKNDQGQYITNAVAKLLVAKLTNNILGSDVEASSTSAADSGNQFRYDSSSNQYMFNLGTSGMSTGTWQLKITLDDGSFRTINVSLK